MFIVTPIVISTFVSTLVYVTIAIISWRRRREQAFSIYFAIASIFNAFWTLMVTLGYAAVPLQLKIFFAILDAWGYLPSHVFLILFGLSFAGYEQVAQKKWVKAILIFYASSNLLLISTNPWHKLLWKDFIPQANNVVLFVHGPAFAWNVITGYLWALTSLIILVVASFRGSNITKRQARVMILALLINILLNVAYHTGFGGVRGVDWDSVTSSIFNLLILWALYGYKFLDIVPIARNKLINNLSDGMIALDLKNRIIDINRSAAEILGSTEDGLLAKKLEDVFPHFGSELKDAPEKEVKFELSTNNQNFYDVLISPLREDWPTRLVGRLIILRNVTERKRTELKLLQLHKAVEQSPVSVVITDIKGNIEYVNPYFSQLTGYTLTELHGKNPRIIQSGNTTSEVYKSMWQTIRSGKVWRGELLNKKKNGELYWEVEIIAPVIDNDGVVVNYIAIKEDVTAQKESEAKLRNAYTKLEEQIKEIQELQNSLREQAIRDSLTGLHNRHYLNEVLGRELSRALREQYRVSFMLLDVDCFKSVNDMYGHAAGDIVLKEVADQLSEFTRAEDIVCRYGGEEFLVVLPNISEQDAFLIADRLRTSIQESTINAGENNISITISAGLSEFPAHGHYEALALEAADKALYYAKQNGRNQVALWSKIRVPY